MRFGILQTDQVMERFRDRHGDYPQMFMDVLCEAADGAPLAFDSIDARDGAYPDPDACDAYLITGSRHSVYDDLPWIPALAGFVGEALGAGSKVIGICFGHQLMAHFFGGLTEPAPGWAVGVHQSRIVADAPWLEPKMERFGLLSSHKDQVTRLPEGAELIASNECCPIAGVHLGRGRADVSGPPRVQETLLGGSHEHAPRTAR